MFSRYALNRSSKGECHSNIAFPLKLCDPPSTWSEPLALGSALPAPAKTSQFHHGFHFVTNLASYSCHMLSHVKWFHPDCHHGCSCYARCVTSEPRKPQHPQPSTALGSWMAVAYSSARLGCHRSSRRTESGVDSGIERQKDDKHKNVEICL